MTIEPQAKWAGSFDVYVCVSVLLAAYNRVVTPSVLVCVLVCHFICHCMYTLHQSHIHNHTIGS